MMKKTLTYLIATAALMVICAVAMAQGGASPMVGSTHNYYVNAANSTINELQWTVLEGSDKNEYDINSGETGETVNITWNTTGTYTLQFEETADGTGCITLKQIAIVVEANTFDVSTSNPAATCNAADGQINVVGPDTTTSISIIVDMTTSGSFSPDWDFSFTLSSNTGATVSNVRVGGTLITPTLGTYTAPSQNSSSGSGSVEVTMDVTGSMTDLEDMILTITSATELEYNTPDLDSDDWTATQTINAIPKTTDIATD